MKFTEEEKKMIITNYESGLYSVSGISRKYKCSPGTITKILRDNNIFIINDMSILKRKYPIDDSFFEVIDTEEKAYFLGLLYADGYNHNKGNMVSIELQEEDKEILEKFIVALKYDGKKLTFNDRTEKRPTCKPTYILSITCKKIAADLTRLGCYNKKSLTLKFPTEEQVPEHLLRHFIRGHFDGDGSMSTGWVSNTPIIRSNITSTLEFCTTELQYIIKTLSINGRVNNCGHNSITSRIDITGNRQVYKFLKWMYEDSSIFLKRKYDKFRMIEDKIIYRPLMWNRPNEIISK